ncbi:SPT2-domain-containing protein [Hesseltinella vesiculosa]|uniref:SPT2-domain-containing protein n=1 Tax=Hesseltinella vesiculosa TaxID=101127 RepID=A0A1X2GWF5_9FUNG|nr:SPT2-domain-containing protein [Hesseltinella vesiculosa]
MSYQEVMAIAKGKPESKPKIPKPSLPSEPEPRPAPSPRPKPSASELKRPAAPPRRPPPSGPSSHLFVAKRASPAKPLASSSTQSTLTTRERLKLQSMAPRKVTGAKRDRESIEDIQQELRKKRSQQEPRPPARDQQRPLRMPFRRAPDPRRSRYYGEEDEYDEEDDFVVRDEEDEDDYSSEIQKMFKYDRKRYVDDYSDDDMEADSRQILMEEKRSARLGRKEDLLEEKLEMQRQQRRMGKQR